jgi:hypothetical protein
VGHPQDTGARRASGTIVVGPVGRSAPTICAAAANSNGTDAAAGGLRAGMVAAGGISSPAEVPRASTHGGIARHRGRAAG